MANISQRVDMAMVFGLYMYQSWYRDKARYMILAEDWLPVLTAHPHRYGQAVSLEGWFCK